MPAAVKSHCHQVTVVDLGSAAHERGDCAGREARDADRRTDAKAEGSLRGLGCALARESATVPLGA